MNYNPLTFSIGLILACWNNPINMQAMLNKCDTNWPGDPYALMAFQQQKQMVSQIQSS